MKKVLENSGEVEVEEGILMELGMGGAKWLLAMFVRIAGSL